MLNEPFSGSVSQILCIYPVCTCWCEPKKPFKFDHEFVICGPSNSTVFVQPKVGCAVQNISLYIISSSMKNITMPASKYDCTGVCMRYICIYIYILNSI